MFSGTDVTVHLWRKKNGQPAGISPHVRRKWEKGEMVDRDSSTVMASIMDTKQIKQILSLLAFTYDTFHMADFLCRRWHDRDQELPQGTHRLIGSLITPSSDESGAPTTRHFPTFLRSKDNEQIWSRWFSNKFSASTYHSQCLIFSVGEYQESRHVNVTWDIEDLDRFINLFVLKSILFSVQFSVGI